MTERSPSGLIHAYVTRITTGRKSSRAIIWLLVLLMHAECHSLPLLTAAAAAAAWGVASTMLCAAVAPDGSLQDPQDVGSRRCRVPLWTDAQ